MLEQPPSDDGVHIGAIARAVGADSNAIRYVNINLENSPVADVIYY